MSESPVPALPPRRPTLVPAPGPQPEPAHAVLWLGALALLVRLAVFFVNDNVNGDAVARTDLAARWAAEPHLLTSFKDGAFQFGPLHLYLVGLALKLGLPREDAGRWLSLLFGTLTVAPLYALTRRLFNARAAVVACVGFALWGMHVQLSTIAASEALGGLLTVLVALYLAEALQDGSIGPVFYAAFFLNLLCAVRYEAWPWVLLLPVLLALHGPDRVAGITRAVLFGLTALAYPLLWMRGSEIDMGDAFQPFHYIDQFHRDWAVSEMAWKGAAIFRLEGLGFFPGAALLTLTPVMGSLALWGLYRTARTRPELRWVAWWVVLPLAGYAVRTAALGTFVPMARLAVAPLLLVLPFTWAGFEAVAGEWSNVQRRLLAFAAALLAVAVPLALGVLAFRGDGKVAAFTRAVSPVSRNEPAVRAVSGWLKSQAPGSDARDGLVLDRDDEYRDLQLAFFSGLPEERMARYRWQPSPQHPSDGTTYPERMQVLRPRWLVLTDKGHLLKDSKVQPVQDGLLLDGVHFRPVPGFDGAVRLFE
ncbi:MAG: glycosyltransferase family 39 protein, partial [Deltaproteobacteria bacterium]|nr:glycosyltransferase family 39 protein [Deltaproteobacteria bacterium]